MAAFDTNGMYFGHFIGYGAETGHGAERNASEIHVETCDNDSDSIIGQLGADIYQAVVKELGLIYTDYIHFRCKKQDSS